MNNLNIKSGDELTNDIIKGKIIAQQLLDAVAAKLPERAYDPSWLGGTGYFDPMVRMDLNVGEGFTTRDDVNRLLVVLPGDNGNVIYFDRYGDRSGPVTCNGFSSDLAPSWSHGHNRSPSGYCADNDQFCEPLLRRAG